MYFNVYYLYVFDTPPDKFSNLPASSCHTYIWEEFANLHKSAKF